VKLSPPSEEVAGFFAALVGTQYAENPVFCRNFFTDFKEVLRDNDRDCPIKEFSKCDFTPMTEYFAEQRELKKQMSKEEKDKLKQEKQKIDEQYGWAQIDGRREKVGNFRVEPPGLFRGRGDHPKTGKLKRRVQPEDITINMGQEAKVPDAPAGHQWGGIVHDNTVAWLATWTENINGNTKYVMFAATSSLKGISDYKKFEKARELKVQYYFFHFSHLVSAT
jgi:DNA topoisomerase I